MYTRHITIYSVLLLFLLQRYLAAEPSKFSRPCIPPYTAAMQRRLHISPEWNISAGCIRGVYPVIYHPMLVILRVFNNHIKSWMGLALEADIIWQKKEG